MTGMDTDNPDPLHLSLDDMIKLNRFRNLRKAEEEASTSDAVNINSSNNGVFDEDFTTSIQNKLRDTPQNGNRTIFDRLGWKRPNQNFYGGKTMAQNQALRAVRNAQQFKNRPVRVIKNQRISALMPPPLTTHVLRKHNETLGNFTVRRRNGPGSVHSMSTQSVRPHTFRHSLKKCLDPEIQALLKNLVNDGKPATVGGVRGQVIVDHTLLQDYRIKSDTTAVPTHIRFSMYN